VIVCDAEFVSGFFWGEVAGACSGCLDGGELVGGEDACLYEDFDERDTERGGEELEGAGVGAALGAAEHAADRGAADAAVLGELGLPAAADAEVIASFFEAIA
jgi:hypothetical protein